MSATTFFADMVNVNTATTGVGTMTLGTAATIGGVAYQTEVNAGVPNLAVVDYRITDGANWEIGWGVYTVSGRTLTRNVIQTSNNNTTALTLSGVATVILTVLGRSLGVPAATLQKNVGNITNPTSSSYLMGGMNATLKPLRSGNVLITVNGYVGPNSSGPAAGVGIFIELYFGTGSAPALNAALTGTQFGNPVAFALPTAGSALNGAVPLSLTAVVTGLTIGTTYWFDIAQKFLSAANLSYQGVSVTIVELP